MGFLECCCSTTFTEPELYDNGYQMVKLTTELSDTTTRSNGQLDQIEHRLSGNMPPLIASKDSVVKQLKLLHQRIVVIAL